MPRHKTDLPQDVMIACARCGGDGVIGQRDGADVPCPACGGDGRIDSREFTRFQRNEERRYASYEGDPTFTAPGREEAVVALTRVEANQDHVEAAMAGDTANLPEDNAPAGVVQVAPIVGGREQHFQVVGGFAELGRAINENDTTVRVEVLTDTTGRSTGIMGSTVGQFMARNEE